MKEERRMNAHGYFILLFFYDRITFAMGSALKAIYR